MKKLLKFKVKMMTTAGKEINNTLAFGRKDLQAVINGMLSESQIMSFSVLKDGFASDNEIKMYQL